ncbi:hypothetical protein PC9H_002192 [Pleurotus ostreatus]|uniref:Uncharacterized protein n=1 Tax=Pleurotus ostreatus TaxID=5322 RepID=A0A8H7DQ88_PLEOS|nr:uncharacterized protein PC9H_002192 [Pleurotus ostreatus]KAF7419601.1 hypothetical protein PC9H_002192 [Pleurotus ostreatus]
MSILTRANLGDCPFRNIGYHVVDNSSNDIHGPLSDPRQENREASGASTKNTNTRSLNRAATYFQDSRIKSVSGRNIGHTVIDKSSNNNRCEPPTERGPSGGSPQDELVGQNETFAKSETITNISGRNIDCDRVTDHSSNNYCDPSVSAERYELPARDVDINSSDGAPTLLKEAKISKFRGRNVGYTVTDNSSNNCSHPMDFAPTFQGSCHDQHTTSSPSTGTPTVLEGASITQALSGRNIGLDVTDNSWNNCGTRPPALRHGGGSEGSPINQPTSPTSTSTPSVLKRSSIGDLSGRNIGINVIDYSENNSGGASDSGDADEL